MAACQWPRRRRRAGRLAAARLPGAVGADQAAGHGLARLKSLGAIYLQNSAAALPASVAAERALRKLRSEILDMSGTAALLSCAVLAGEADVRAAFQAARDDEYEEIVDKCDDFLARCARSMSPITSPTPSSRRTRSTWSSCGTGWHRVRDRDVFGAARAGRAAETALAECEEQLEAYAARVYAEEAESR